MTTLTTSRATVAQLRATIRGQLITPDDADYDAARRVFFGGIDRRPAVIVRPVDATEVASVVSHARETGLELAIRSGGHSSAGHAVTEGGIVLDLAELRALEIDAENRVAWAQTGLTAGEYTTAAARYGLATGFGDTGSVGIGGLTLGGGIGYLVRKHGLTIDNVLAAEIATADGHIHHVDKDAYPELFWAIRGGGGNFGVVTRLQFRLHDVNRVVGGMLMLPATAQSIHDFVAESQAAPDELTTIANIMAAPPLPFVAPEHHGQLVIMATLCYAGDLDDADRVLAPFRALATPIVDMVRPMAYPEIFPPNHDGEHPVALARNLFVDTLDHTRAETIIDRLRSSTASMAAAQLRVLGGAMARVPSDTTAFAHRDRRIMANVAAVYQHPDEAAPHAAWADDFADALRDGDTGAYVNFIGDEGTDRVRDAYPGPTWDRLTEIKAEYDPANVFRVNQNVPPRARGL